MGAEYSRTNRHATAGRFLIYDVYGSQRHGGPTDRCMKCSGSGRLSVEYTCDHCRNQDRTTWSNYNGNCSCNGYGRQTVTELCDDCFGRGRL